MLIRYFFLILSLLLCHDIYAAGPACFNYEMHEHQNLAPAGLNRALVNYPHGLVVARNAVIPALGPGALQVEVSLSRQLGAVIPWQHAPIALGAGLNLQEGCQMAIDRQHIGITVDFQHPLLIALVAAGFPVGAAAAFLGIPPGYLQTALARGGYLNPLAASIYRFRHNFPPPNFVFLMAPMPANADTVMIQIHDLRRVSKNVKELSYNAILNPGLPGLPYISIKDMIDGQFALLGLPVPHSGTIISADFLQLN